MTNRRGAEVVFSYKLDKRSVADVQRANADLLKQEKDIRAAFDNTRKAITDAATAFKATDVATAGLRGNLAQIVSNFKDVAVGGNATRAALDGITKFSPRLAELAKITRNLADNSEDVRGAFSGTAGIALPSAAAAIPGEDSLQRASQQTGDGVKRLAEQTAQLGQTLPGAAGGVAEIVGAVLEGGPVLGVFALGVAAVTAAFADAEAQAKATRDAIIAQTTAGLDAAGKAAVFERSGDVDSATEAYITSQAAVTEAFETLGASEQRQLELLVERDQRQQELNALIADEQSGNPTFTPAEFARRYGELQSEITSLDSQIAGTEESIRNASSALATATQENDAYAAVLERMGVDLSTLTPEALASAEALKETQQSLAQLGDELRRSQQTIASIAQQRRDVLAREEQRLADAAIDATIEKKFALEDAQIQEAAQLKAHLGNLASITERGQTDIAKLTDQLNALPGKLLADRQAVFAEFAGSEKEAERELGKELLKIQTDTLKRRNQIQQQFDDAALAAELNNSTLAFLQAQRQRDQQDAEAVSGADEATRERIAARNEERAAAREALQQRLADIQSAAEAERANLQAQVEARRAQTESEITEARKAFDERQRLEAEAAKREADRDAVRENLAEQRRQRELAAQLAGIDRQIAAEVKAQQRIQAEIQRTAQAGIEAFRSIGSAAAASAAAAFGSGGLSGGTTGSSGSANGGGRRAFATGGLFGFNEMRPGQELLVGERGAELGRVTSRGIEFTPLGGGGGGGLLTQSDLRSMTSAMSGAMGGFQGNFATKAETRAALQAMFNVWVEKLRGG